MKSIWIFLALIMITTGSYAGETIAVVFDNSASPMQYADESGEAAGLYPAVIREIFNRMKVTYTFEALPWKRVIEEINTTMDSMRRDGTCDRIVGRLFE